MYAQDYRKNIGEIQAMKKSLIIWSVLSIILPVSSMLYLQTVIAHTPLSDDSPISDYMDSDDTMDDFQFNVGSSSWYAIVATELQSNDLELDQMTAYDAGTTEAEVSDIFKEGGGYNYDYVGIAIDGRHVSSIGEHTFDLTRYRSSGNYYIEMEKGNTNQITSSGTFSGSFNSNEVIDIYEVNVESTITGLDIFLDVPSNADLDLLLFAPDSLDPYKDIRRNSEGGDAVEASTRSPSGTDEEITYNRADKADGWYSIVIINSGGGASTNYYLNVSYNGYSLSDDIPYEDAIDSVDNDEMFNFNVGSSSWYAIVATELQSNDLELDQMTAYDAGTTEAEVSDIFKEGGGYNYDYVGIAIDGRHVSSIGEHTFDLTRYRSSGNYYIEMEKGNTNQITSSGTFSGSFGPKEVIDIYEMSFNSEDILNLSLTMDPSADLDLLIFEPDIEDPFMDIRGNNNGGDTLVASCTASNGASESIDLTILNKGFYSIVIVNNGGRQSDYNLKVIYTPAPNNLPECSITASPNSGIAPLTVTFNGSAYDCDGTIVSYHWDFGDNSTSTDKDPTHTFENAGTYSITLTVSDNDNATGTDTVTIIVNEPTNKPPTASIIPDKNTGTAPLTVSFTGSGTDSDGTVVSYYWSFGDNSTSTDKDPTHTFENAGTYSITLTVSDNDNATGTDTVTIIVNEPTNKPPTASIIPDKNTGTAPLTVSFTGSGTDSDGTVVSYYWSFGDGSTSTKQNPTYTFLNAGTYSVTLTVTDNKGATGIKKITITVNEKTTNGDNIQNINDRDGDGVIDSKDAYPDDPTMWQRQIEEKSNVNEKFPWLWIIIVITIIAFVIIVVMVLIVIKKRQPSPPYSQQPLMQQHQQPLKPRKHQQPHPTTPKDKTENEGSLDE